MTEEEMEAAIVALQAENEELQQRVEYLENRAASGHSCVIDLCDLGDDGRCRLRRWSE